MSAYIVLSIIIFFFGLAIAIGLYGLIKSRVSRSWPTVEGKIIRSELKERRNKGRTSYKPRIEYVYTVRGKDYIAKTINFCGRMTPNTPEKAQAYMAPYQQGSSVRVFYNPRNPKDACLVNTEQKVSYLFIFVGITGILITGIIWYAKAAGYEVKTKSSFSVSALNNSTHLDG